jgi:ABC-type Mn2+/Zn2+ transport system permease subunit
VRLLSWLWEPLEYEFMRQALVLAVLLGMLCPVVGSLLIVQRLALLGDVISHAVLPGLAASLLLKIDLFVGALLAGAGSMLLVAWVQERSRLKADAVLGLVSAGFLALGTIGLSRVRVRVDLESLLFGDILAATSADTLRTLVLAAVVLAAVGLLYKELLFYTFDPEGAAACGLPAGLLGRGVLTAATLAIVAGMQAAGVVLVAALLVGPAGTAYLLVNRLGTMMLLGTVFAVVAGVAGLYLSYYLTVPSGAAIVVVVFAGFLLVLAMDSGRTWLARRGLAKR